MSSCPNCGAITEEESTCPRCGATLPSDRSAKGLALASRIIGGACALAAAIQLIIDLAQNGSFTWSLISLASCALAWILVGFPMLAYRSPSIYMPIMVLASLIYLWGIERMTGGAWFLPLALPIAMAAMASAALSVFLCLKVKQRGPNIASFILFGCTLACLAIENVLSLHARGEWAFTWSAIVAISALPTAAILLGIQHRLRARR